MKTARGVVHLINNAADELIPRAAGFHRGMKACDPAAGHEIHHMQGCDG
jgi:hypothetical protein